MLLLFVPLTHAPPSHEYPIIHHTSVPSSITFPSVTRVFHHPSHLHPSHKYSIIHQTNIPSHEYSIIHHIPIHHTSVPSSITFPSISRVFHHISITQALPSHKYSYSRSHTNTSPIYAQEQFSCTHGNNPKIHPTHLITELPCRLLKPRVPCCCISPHSYGRHPERSSCGRQLLPG